MKNLSIDLKEISPFDSLAPIPHGNYVVRISNCEIRLSQAGNPCLSVEFTLTDPPFTNRRLFEYFVLNQPIALRRLKTLAIAGKYPNPDLIKDPSELVGLRLMAKVIIREDDEYGTQNKIAALKPILEGRNPEAPSPKDTMTSQPDLPFNF